MNVTRKTLVLSLAILALTACSTGGSTTKEDLGTGDADGVGPREDGTNSDADTMVVDFHSKDQVSDLPDFAGQDLPDLGDFELPDTLVEGGFGWPCKSNADCLSGYCVPSGDQYVCTVQCEEECPLIEWQCKAATNSYPDAVFICVPPTDKLCKPCKADLDCAAQGDLCVTVGEGAGAGLYCGSDCSVKGTCGAGYVCTEIKDEVTGELRGKQCIPENNSCVCIPGVDATTRPCQIENQFGKCLGSEECKGALGWADCSAKTPEFEVCDTVDNDCDGETDQGFGLVDWDGVTKSMGAACGTGVCGGGVVVCKSLEEATCSTLTNKVSETCNGLDDDCDGEIDEGVKLAFYMDADLDGFGDPNVSQMACSAPAGYVALGTDCDDASPIMYPGNSEACDGIDNNCDLTTDEGFRFVHPDGSEIGLGLACAIGLCTTGQVVCLPDGSDVRCDAVDLAIPEVCDDLDQDCDGTADNGCDDDLDGYCDVDLSVEGVEPEICPDGSGDCNDESEAVHPNTEELCNLTDDDCDGMIDGLVVDCAGAKCEAIGLSYFETSEAQCQTGTCVAPAQVACGLYTCLLGGTLGAECAEACVDDSTCVVSAHCNETLGVCAEDISNGLGCVESSDCKSGHCANGFCCDAGECCAQPGDCPATYSAAPSCDSTATCQGSRVDAMCLSNTCAPSSAIADDSACGTGLMALECDPYPDRYCAGTVSQTAPVCSATCSNDAQCDAGFHCDGTCQQDLGDGFSCDEDSDCSANHCQNGFCCASGDCCSMVSDCPASYTRVASCDTVAACQGTRQDASCVESRCVKSANIDDDSACVSGQLAKVCNPYQSLLCSGSPEQTPANCPTTCLTDSECVSGYHCDGTCVANVSDGGGCDENTDCHSNYCSNGFCCSGGTCCAQPSNCPSALFAVPATCGDSSTCQGTRIDATCLGSKCGSSDPIADDSDCSASLQALDCTPYLSKFCTGAANQTPPTCASGCTSDGQCAEGYHCDGTCKPDVPDGGICDETSDCISNHCKNGFCCASGDCCQVAMDCPATYARAASCDSTSSCQGTRQDRQCGGSICSTTLAIDDDTACSASTLALDCLPYQSRYCTGAANQNPPTCATACTVDSQCQTGYHCDWACEANQANGAPCDENSDCVSTHCQNGYCCGFGDCCSVAGNCPVGSYSEAAVCGSTSTCQGTRRDPACVNSECRKSDPINDDSACLSSTLSDECGPYPTIYCDGGVTQSDPPCPTSCTTDAQCDTNAHCEGGTCQADKADGGSCTAGSWCTSGQCVDGVCCETACSGSCRACNLAGNLGKCMMISAGTDPANECPGFACTGYYWGWSGDKCLARSAVDSATATCDGAGACRTAATLCPLQGSGATTVECNATCQDPTSGTCQSTTAGACTNVNPGTHSCGTGECYRTVNQCLNGAPNPCVQGNPTTETCDNKDQNCNGTNDDSIPNGGDIYEYNETCSTNKWAGDIAEGSPDALIVVGNIYPQNDVDFFTIQAKEDSHVCFPGWPQTYNLTVRMNLPQSPDCVDYDLFVYYYDTGALTCSLAGSAELGGCQSESVTVTWGGTCAGNDSRYFAIQVIPYLSSWECATYSLYADMF